MFLSHDTGRVLILTLRGTASFSDAKTDLKYKPVRAWKCCWCCVVALSTNLNCGVAVHGVGPPQKKYVCPYPSVKAKVHRGFYNAYLSIAPAVARTTKRLFETGRYDSMVVCGHSLGGALATLAALHITWELGPGARKQRDRLVPVVSCYTYGSPRVGDRSFRDFYNRLVPDTWRHVNDEDGVPRVPPKFLGFRHVGWVRHTAVLLCLAGHAVPRRCCV